MRCAGAPQETQLRRKHLSTMPHVYENSSRINTIGFGNNEAINALGRNKTFFHWRENSPQELEY